MSEFVKVKVLDRLIHQGLVRKVGDTLSVEASHAESLVKRGVAELESKRLTRRKAADDDGSGDDSSKSPDDSK